MALGFSKRYYIIFRPLNPFMENKVEQWGMNFWEARRQTKMLNKVSTRFGIFYVERQS